MTHRDRGGPQSLDSLAAFVGWDSMVIFMPPAPLAPSPGHAREMARRAQYRSPRGCVHQTPNETLPSINLTRPTRAVVTLRHDTSVKAVYGKTVRAV